MIKYTVVNSACTAFRFVLRWYAPPQSGSLGFHGFNLLEQGLFQLTRQFQQAFEEKLLVQMYIHNIYIYLSIYRSIYLSIYLFLGSRVTTYSWTGVNSLSVWLTNFRPRLVQKELATQADDQVPGWFLFTKCCRVVHFLEYLWIFQYFLDWTGLAYSWGTLPKCCAGGPQGSCCIAAFCLVPGQESCHSLTGLLNSPHLWVWFRRNCIGRFWLKSNCHLQSIELGLAINSFRCPNQAIKTNTNSVHAELNMAQESNLSEDYRNYKPGVTTPDFQRWDNLWWFPFIISQ